MISTCRFALLVWLILGASVASLAAQEDEELDRWYDRGRRAYERGQWDRALRYLERYEAAEPGDVEVRGMVLVALRGAGEYVRLEERTAALLRENPEDRAVFLARIDVLLATGRDDEALDALRAWEGPGAGGYLLKSIEGRIHLERGRDDRAGEIFEELVDRAKREVVSDPYDLVGLGRAYRFYPHGGDYAEEAYVSAQKGDPECLLAYEELAEVYGTLKELPSDMKREYLDALERRPSWPDYYVGIARAAELRLGMAEDEKRQMVARALEIDPRHPDALFMRGEEQLEDALWDQARESFEKGLETNPHHKDCLAGLAAQAWLVGDRERWRLFERRVLDRDPTFGRLHRILASSLNARRRWREAFESMQRAVEIDASDPRLWDDLARYALWIGEEEAGKKALEKADGLVRYGSVWRNNMITVMELLAKEYETEVTDHYAIKLHRLDRPVLGRFLPEFVEASFAEFVERYGFTPTHPIVFEVFRRSKDFSVRTMGTKGLPALGVCFGTTVAMDSPTARRPGTYNWEATAHHEIAHVFTLQLSQGRVPRWLTEGLSSWEEVRRDRSWGRDMEIQLHDALHGEDLLGVLEFDGAFSTPRIGFAYYQGGLACEWIETRWGIEKIREMLKLYARDLRTVEVLKRALDVDPDEFDAGFRAFVAERLAPLKRMPTYGDAAMKRFREAAEGDGDAREARIGLAWGYHRRDKDFDADAALAPLVAAGVEDPRIDLLLGMRALKGKRLGLAKERFEKVLAAGHEDFDMFVALARMAEGEGDDAAALSWWRRARGANPWAVAPSSSPFLALARLRRAAGDFEGWAEELEAYCDLVDVAVPPRKELLAYRKEKGQTERVLELMAEIGRIVPFDYELRMEWGRLLGGLDDSAGARLQFELAVEIAVLRGEPEPEAAARLELGKIWSNLGDEDEASFQLSRVLELDPGNAEARELLKKIDDR